MEIELTQCIAKAFETHSWNGSTYSALYGFVVQLLRIAIKTVHNSREKHKHGSTLALFVCVFQGVFVYVEVFVCVCVCVWETESRAHTIRMCVWLRIRENFAAGIKSTFCGLPKWVATKSAREMERERQID